MKNQPSSNVALFQWVSLWKMRNEVPGLKECETFKLYNDLRISSTNLQKMIEEELLKKRLEEQAEIVKRYTFVEKGNAMKYEDFLNPILSEEISLEEKKYFNFVWLNAFANIKRKMMGLSTEWDVMPIIYSPVQGNGKSFLVRKFKDFFGDLGIETSFQFLKTEREQNTVTMKYFVFIDELAGISRNSSSAALKNLITSETNFSRMLYKQDGKEFSNNAVFFGASNYEINKILPEPGRRFVEIKVTGNRLNDFTNSIDIKDFWNSIDPHFPYHLVVQSHYTDKVNSKPQRTTVLDFLETFEIKMSRDISIKLLWNEYQRWCRQHNIPSEQRVEHKGYNSEFKKMCIACCKQETVGIQWDDARNSFSKKS